MVLLGVAYASFGVKLVFLFLANYISLTVNEDEISVLEASKFAMDIALGQEFRVGDTSYTGLRLAYYLNVIKPYELPSSVNEFNMFYDDFGVPLTYRYAFNSK